MSVSLLRRIAMIACPVLTAAAGGLGYFFPSFVLIDWVFKVSLSATVGIWTNHFAIRMLFRPHERTVFGRQGLIPAKRSELARATGEAVAERLLDTDSVLAYLDDNGLLEKGAQMAVDRVHKLITGAAARSATSAYLQRIISGLLDRHSESAVLRVQKFVTGLVTERTSAGRVWPAARQWLQGELSNPETRESLAHAVISLADRYDAEIAAFVNDALEEYIRSRKLLEKMFLGLGKKVFKVDGEQIRAEIRRHVGSPGFFDAILALLDENTPEIEAWLDSPGVRVWFRARLDDLREKVSFWIRTEGMELGMGKVRELLSSDELWNWVSGRIDDQVETLAEAARRKIRSPEFRHSAREFAGRAVSGIDVKGIVRSKIDRFDLNELEELVLSVSGENLAAIELFGAVLGGLAGLVLIDVRFLPLLPLLVALFLVVEKALTRVFKKA